MTKVGHPPSLSPMVISIVTNWRVYTTVETQNDNYSLHLLLHGHIIANFLIAINFLDFLKKSWDSESLKNAYYSLDTKSRGYAVAAILG